MTYTRTLLWVDDDGEERFLYEKYNLWKRGWSITWALTVFEAARILTEKSFDAILLDQMLPPQKYEDEHNIWGGCALLYWLRGGGLLPNTKDFDFLGELTPLRRNREIGVTLVSAFYDEEIQSYIKGVPGPAVELVQKPINLPRLLSFLPGPVPA